MLEVRIPISWRADFVNRCLLIHKALRQFYPDAITRVTVNPDRPNAGAYDVDGLIWDFMPAGADQFWKGTAHEYIAGMMRRFEPPFQGDHILMLDADIMPMAPFDELLTGDTLKACMAHVGPFFSGNWLNMFSAYKTDGFHPDAWRPLSGSKIMLESTVLSPPYFNTGVVAAPATLLEKLYAPYMDALAFVKSKMDSYFFEQIALTLALAKTHLPYEIMPMRYNFPNQKEFDAALPDDLADVRLLHFLRTDDGVHREQDFGSDAAMGALAGRHGLTGSNEKLRARVASLL